MYYLSCVTNLVDFDHPRSLTDYQNYDDLDYDDINSVLLFALLLEPKIFIENNIMIQVSSLNNASNEFYKITNTRTAVAATREFVIGGKRVHTLEIMAFERSWLQRNYLNPIEYYEDRIKAILAGEPDKYKPKPKQKSKACNIC